MKNSLIFISLLIVSSCKTNPIDRLTNPLPDGDVSQSSGLFIIYDDELKTEGGLAFIPGGENQTIDLSDVSEPHRTVRQIKYAWNGGDTGSQHLFAGFQLLITPDGTTLASTNARDLSSAGYTQMTMYVRAQLSEGNTLRIEGPSNGDSNFVPARVELDAATLGQGWMAINLAVPAADFSAVKIFATFSIQYAQPPRTTNNGLGGTIFVDELRYER
ncbi:MAG: hypothetical protein KCHDKBKB_02949 [Elusimicrobia bacterium]|nr:hypothetical protein [Elusimicrobiota bacterium]